MTTAKQAQRTPKCRGSYEQVRNNQVSLDGEIACAVCFRVVRALKHPGSRLYRIVPAHRAALAKVEQS